jgi:hypothetical protein
MQSVEHESGPIQTISFPAWARTTIFKLQNAVGIGGVFASAIAISYLDPITWPNKWWNNGLETLIAEKRPQRATLAFVQAAVCLLLAFLTPPAKLPSKFPSEDPKRADIARRACRRINHLLKVVFCLWAAYYLITGLGLLATSGLVDRPILITLSGLTSLFIFWLYLEMGEITIDEGAPEEVITRGGAPEEAAREKAMAYRITAIGVFIIIVAVAWFGYAKSFEHAKTLDVIKTFGLEIPPENMKALEQEARYTKALDLVDLAVAALSGVGLCFVVGRFADKLLNPGAVTLFLLYFYSVIQLGAAVISKDPVVHLTVTTLALPLKFLLWLVCVWAFTTGILAQYLYEVRILIERVDAQRQKKGKQSRRASRSTR